MNNFGKVQKKKKAQKITPFWSHAMAFKNRMKRQGLTIPNDTVLREMAGKEWSMMTDDERNSYKDKAKNSEPIVTKNRTLYNSLGQDIGEVEASKMRAKNENDAMIGEIQLMVDTAYSSGELDNCVFYFINATSFYKSNDDIFPAEIAMAKYSLKEGVFADLHIRINPGQLPLGSGLEAQEKSSKCHKLPVPPNCDGETDYIEVLQKMIKFLQPIDHLPVFFTNGNTRDDLVPYTETCKVVEKIFYEAEEDGVMKDIKIYPIDEFFFILNRRQVVTENTSDQNKGSAFPSIAYASNTFKSDKYEYFATGCDFHNSIDCDRVCCLSKVRRYGYTITEWCNSKNNLYPLIEGKHFPMGYDHRN